MGVKNTLLSRHSRPDRTTPIVSDQLSRDGVFSRDARSADRQKRPMARGRSSPHTTWLDTWTPCLVWDPRVQPHHLLRKDATIGLPRRLPPRENALGFVVAS